MTKDEFEKAVGKIEKGREVLREYEEVLLEVLGSEFAQGIRGELMAAKMSLHATRMVMLVGAEKLRELAPRPAAEGKAA